MKTHARAVVIGGGVVGVSTLYHLAKKGWSDAVLCERTELTAGSTWHAAGLLPLFNMSYSVGQLHKYSVDLYKTLPAETGQDVSFHVTGNLRLATDEERMDEYRKYCGTANTIGVPFEIATPAEIAELWPLCDTDGLVGALYHPDDGHIAPADVTQAMATGARDMGAEIYHDTAVTAVEQRPGGEWLVRTGRGDIVCEHVVCATGNYSWHTSRMLGIYIPAIPVEHQYIVTEEVPELVERHRQGLPEMAVLREPDASYYLREERQGYILGPYEKGAPARFWDGVPDSFERDLFPGDLDRLMPHLEAAIARVPSFERAGIKDIVNGPIAYTPDGSPLVGPAWDLRNVWLNEGHSFGITAAGGAGWQLAEWIVEGEPSIDMMDVDPRRFGAYANTPYVRVKNEEAYEHVFIVHYPDEERPAARPAKTSPIHDMLDGMGAVWGQRYGWERPNWFAPAGVERADVWSFRRTNYFPHVAREHRNVRENVGIVDITSFSKFLVSGPGAETWLDRLLCRRLPRAVGRINLSHALTPRGGVRSEFTVMRDGEQSFYLVSSGAAERYDGDYLAKNLPADGSVRLDNLTTSHATLVVAGPNARAVMAKIAEADLDTESFPWLTGRHTHVGLAPVRLMRINFLGELGWEIHHPVEYQRHIFLQLLRAGAEFDIGQCGMRAMDSLRIEKSYRMWAQDLTREYTVLEAGLGRFAALDKGDFVGRDALIRQRAEGVPREFVTLEVNDVDDADPIGNEPLWRGGTMVGRATSGAYGHFTGKSLAIGYVDAGHGDIGTGLEIEILGSRYPARVIPESPHDPDNERLRS
ncbi:MAG: FAD-dependent oxidoreductase [Defluviicoccus sp.]|nr:FAD-dependent oxidoreductase [Defluviicoccus sp.]MDE0276484.1 FAD-dependent oxidoreductase [Defluviicoccus sp.]